MEPLISICIPAYEMKGKGSEFLEFSFTRMIIQTYQNFEVIISDHSTSDMIENSCKKWGDRLNIKHYYNEDGRGMFPNNMNNAIKHASGDIIKILCQDDFLYDEKSLENLVFQFTNSDRYWLVSACCHTEDGYRLYRPFYPVYHDSIQYGNNTISSPSVLMFKNKDVMPFDENLFWLVDVDYYKMLFDKYGLPGICNIITVVNREDKTRVSSTVTPEVMDTEYQYVVNKYKK